MRADGGQVEEQGLDALDGRGGGSHGGGRGFHWHPLSAFGRHGVQHRFPLLRYLGVIFRPEAPPHGRFPDRTTVWVLNINGGAAAPAARPRPSAPPPPQPTPPP